MLERWLLYVLRAEPNPFSKLLLVYPFAFRLSAFKVFGGAFGLPWRGFGLFGDLGRQNVSRLFGRASFKGVCIVGFDGGKRLRQLGIGSRFCLRAVVLAVLNEDSRT